MAENGIRTLSLFSGGGGLDIGFEKAGFEILFATDFNHECCETLKLNRGNTLSENLIVEQADITTMDYSILPDNIDMIIGGPPCQTFSASARRAGGASGKLDERGNLFECYVEIVHRLQPKAFLFENVRGILGTNKGQDFKDIVSAFAAEGYTIEYRILDAEDYGVPQQRERLFIVGHRLDKKFLYPKPIYGPDSTNNAPYLKVGEVIADIQLTRQDKIETTFEGGKYASLLPLVPPGSNYLHFTAKRGYPNPIFAYRSRFSDFLYKANPETCVKTLIASPGKYTGPLHWDNRYLTVSEYKRIQGFPDEHVFFGDRVAQIRQIGNSVCPKIAYYMALAIKEQIFGIPTGIEYIDANYVLSFDKRKGQKAQKTRALHETVAVKRQKNAVSCFTPCDFETYVDPSSIIMENNVNVSHENNQVTINVICSDTENVEAILILEISDSVAQKKPITLRVIVKGNDEQDIQTMWNAVDAWVKKCSSFRSLIELYGHFTEPHPIFKVIDFEVKTNLPAFQFAKYYMDFAKCGVYEDKSVLLSLWKDKFKTEKFVELARILRSYRYDIRCHETNIAIPQGVYMVAYPFALPFDKQMNFCVKENREL